MKYLHEFRDPTLVAQLLHQIRQQTTRPWTLMEVCGGQTHSILRHGIDTLLPSEIRLIHGPGCPVCVTPVQLIDQALHLAAMPNVTLCTFGDMLRVPGSDADLFTLRANGADVRMVYSPLDALNLARRNPQREVVFFGVGFETTAPATALAVQLAARERRSNFSLLASHVLVPPALEALLQAPGCQVQAFLAAGHVCAVMGTTEYDAIAARYGVPIVVTGFEPVDLLEGIRRAVGQLEAGQARVENAYPRAVTNDGNPHAKAVLAEVFEVTDRPWRGIGLIPASGWQLRPKYHAFDAARKYPLGDISSREHPLCRSGEVLQGKLRPSDCPAFGRLCNPRSPLGATMVSSEGACAAYYHAGRFGQVHPNGESR